MKVTVRLFGHFSDYAHTLEMDVADGSTIGDIAAALAARDGRLIGIDMSCRAALNEEYTTSDAQVCEGDELAFIPPMSGG